MRCRQNAAAPLVHVHALAPLTMTQGSLTYHLFFYSGLTHAHVHMFDYHKLWEKEKSKHFPILTLILFLFQCQLMVSKARLGAQVLPAEQLFLVYVHLSLIWEVDLAAAVLRSVPQQPWFRLLRLSQSWVRKHFFVNYVGHEDPPLGNIPNSSVLQQ